MMATLRRPRWAIGTVICLAIVVLFVNLGFWQLRRLDERRDHNSLVSSRMATAAVGVDALPWSGIEPGDDPGALEYRRVLLAGRWLEGSTVLVRSRALNGGPGYHVLGTLVLDEPDGEGVAVVVNRGFAPLGNGDEEAVIAAAGPAEPRAEIEGVIRRSETRGRIGPTDPASGVLRVLNRVDVGRLQQQEGDVTLAPFFVQQVRPEHRANAIPIVLPLPDFDDEGPHLSYAGQWFLFALVGIVGWPILLRKVSRDEATAASGGSQDDRGGQAAVRQPA